MMLKSIIFLVLSLLLAGFQVYGQDEPLHPISISDIAWSPDGEKFAIAGGDWICDLGIEEYGIRIYDTNPDTLLLILEAHTCTVESIAWSPNGNYLVSGGADGVAYVWDTNTGNLVSRTPRKFPIARVAESWRPDGSQIADVFLGSSTIYIWDVMSGEPINTYESEERISSHSWNSDSANSLIAFGIFNGVQLFDPDTMTIIDSFQTSIPAGDIIQLAWSPDNSLLAAGSVEGSLHVWDISTGTETVLLLGHTEPILDLAWSPDGNNIISSALDNTVRIWDIAASQEIEQFTTRNSPVAVAWKPDGSQIAFTGNPLGDSAFAVEFIDISSISFNSKQ